MAEQVPNVENTAQESNNEPNAKNRNKTVDNPVKTDGVVSQKESKESEVLKAFFEKQGLSEEELKKAISMYKENIPKSAPDVIVAKEKEQKYMLSNTQRPRWLTDEVIKELTNDIAICPNPYTEQDINELELDGTVDLKRNNAYMAIKTLKKYGILHDI